MRIRPAISPIKEEKERQVDPLKAEISRAKKEVELARLRKELSDLMRETTDIIEAEKVG